MPSEDLVERVARALHDHRESLAMKGWTGWHDLPESWRDEWRDAARAALAAMPQPVGYTLYRCNEVEAWTYGDVVSDREIAEAMRDILASGSRYPTIVAIIPIEEVTNAE